MRSCRRSGTPACSALSRGSTGATASRNICATSPESGPTLLVHWPTRPSPAAATGTPPTSRRRVPRDASIYHLLATPALIWERPCSLHARGCQIREFAMATSERRKGDRVTFERGYPAHMMGIDGTWRRECVMEDVSETGAKLTVEGSVEGLHLKEFFLLLSSTGLAYRRCELAWVNGDQIGVNFLKQSDKKKKAAAAKRGAESADA